MSRLDLERQNKLEPIRMEYCKQKLEELGFSVEVFGKTRLEFLYKGHRISMYPYSGWHTGKTIQEGRGINNLIKQLR